MLTELVRGLRLGLLRPARAVSDQTLHTETEHRPSSLKVFPAQDAVGAPPKVKSLTCSSSAKQARAQRV